MTNTARWLAGLAGTWLILALLAEYNGTADLAAALAIAVAFGVTFSPIGLETFRKVRL